VISPVKVRFSHSARLLRALSLVLFATLCTTASLAATPPRMADAKILPHPALAPIPAGAQFDASGHLDPETATQAYLNTLSPEKRHDSDKYFEGGYWFILWDALYSIAIMLFLLYSGISAKIRDFAVARTPRPWLQTAIYYVPFILFVTLLSAPLTWYEGFYREHIYQQSHQSLGSWMHDQFIALVLSLVLGTILVTILYAVARRLPRTWHLWGAAVVILFIMLASIAAPVYIAPLFNTYSRIQDPAVVSPILKMASANGIPVTDLYQVDASKQTTRVSANVSGLFNTTRITLNDNLLRTGSIEEIEAVTGHEMGHYVLHHVIHGLVESIVIIFIVFFILRAWLESMQRRHGDRWRTSSIYDPALLPAIFLIFSVIFLLLTPVTNTGTRLQEHEADMFGLNASRQPDGFAQSMLKLGQYRKLSPTPLEEFIFFDHPSGHTRILDAMRWKNENQGTTVYK
jgi:STE24 endopeptidase